MIYFLSSKDHSASRFWSYIAYCWIFFFISLPFLIIFFFCFLKEQPIGLCYQIPIEFDKKILTISLSFGSIFDMIFSSFYWIAYWNSICLSFYSTLVCFFAAYPLMFLASQFNVRWRLALMGCLLLPYVTSCMIRLYSLKNFLSPKNWFYNLFFTMDSSSLIWDSLLSDSYMALIIGMAYIYTPFIAYPIYLSLIKIPRSLIEAASDLGARPSDILKKIILPLSLPGIETGATVVFLFSFCDCTVAEFFGRDQFPLWGRLLYQTVTVEKNWPMASVMAVISLSVYIFPFIFFYLLKFFVKIPSLKETVDN